MKLSFKYSFLKEPRVAFKLITHRNDYKNLRSVIWPTPVAIFRFVISFSKALHHTQILWNCSKFEVENTFKKLNLADPGNIDCFLHGISCEGWFDTDTNSISIRYINNGGEKELLSTIIHELLHLVTFKNTMSYDEREDLVDYYLEKPEFQKILSTKSI